MLKFYARFFFVLIILCFTKVSIFAQNVGINIAATNAGKIEKVGESIFLKIFITNTSPSLTVAAYRLRPLIFIPAIITVAPDGHILPTGWNIVSTSATNFRLSNGTGTIPPNTQREISIRIIGTSVGGPLTVNANMQFANGVAPGTVVGSPTTGNNTADDASSANIEVLNPLPVSLSNFNGVMVNCQSLLNWTTQTEQNSDHFEIQKTANSATGHWASLGTVTAAGNSFNKRDYTFTDKNIGENEPFLFYRLKKVDKDGSFTYSKIIKVQNICLGFQIVTFPNPVENGRLFIKATGLPEKTRVSLISMVGQVIQERTITEGLNTLHVNNLSAGIYQMAIRNGNGIIYTGKILVK